MKSSKLKLVDGLTQAPSGKRIRQRRLAMQLVLLFITTILAPLGHQHLEAQEVAREEPPAAASQAALPEAPTPQQDGPLDLMQIPHATPFSPGKVPDRVVLESDNPQTKTGDVLAASGNVVITYRDHIIYADSVTYDKATGEVNATGHLKVIGGENDEHIEASHGTYNLHTGTGRFYDVSGSVGLGKTNAKESVVTPVITSTSATGGRTGPRSAGYQNSNPFLFEGRIVVKTGPENYDVYDGAVTSCLLPNPDWQLFANHFNMDGDKAKAYSSNFRLLGIPVFYLPYVTHPVDADERQSGLLIPTIGYSSASKDTGSKGFTIGEQAYLTLGRSADLTVGTLYYSLRGFSENGTFRYRGPGDDFLTAHFSALQDRGFTSAAGLYQNQGGQDITVGYRKQLTTTTRAVVDAEYLSSYIYREVFTENFNQAVSSDITSTLYLMHERNGFALDGRVDRYQGLKVVAIGTTPGEEVKIFHAPSIDLSADDHRIEGTPLLWDLDTSVAALKRTQPDFASAGMTERVDVHPELSLPLHLEGWNVMSSLGARDTFYSRSRQAPYGANATPIELTQTVNRSDFEATVDIRPPVLERTFTVPARFRKLLGDEVRHTIEPDITYRDVQGISNFLNILRFDDIDLASNTDELAYGVTQHLYFRPRPKPKKAAPKPGCPVQEAGTEQSTGNSDGGANLPDVFNPTPQAANNDANGIPNAWAAAPDVPLRTHGHHPDPCAPDAAPANPPQQEWFSWRLEQKHFFNQTFGGAVIDRRRNIFDSTLSFSGVAFLTEPRSTSPLISRMRFRTSGHTDIEYDFDYDTGATKFTSQNVFLDVHSSRFFGGFSYARLNAPGRFYTEVIDTTTNTATGLTSSAVSNFSQMRVLLGYGTPSKPGLSAAVGSGIDLNLGSAQYITVQTGYNWNCCGLSVEYRKYDFGTIRNEGTPSFSFTLANIGSAGNLRRNQSLF
jgi:LPS-assembly protein